MRKASVTLAGWPSLSHMPLTSALESPRTRALTLIEI
jgi:hypothetical protein